MFEKLEACPVCDNTTFTNLFTCKDHEMSQESFMVVACSACQLKITNPRPAKSQLAKYYHDTDRKENLKTTLQNSLFNYITNKNFNDRFKYIYQYKTSGSILDYGCGDGTFLSSLKKQGWDTQGLEEINQLNKKSCLKLNQEICTNLDQFPPTPKFDIITFWNSFQNIEDYNTTLPKIRKLLKKEGYIILECPNNESYQAKIYQANWAGYNVPRNYYHFTPTTLRKLLRKHKLKIKEHISSFTLNYYYALLTEKHTKKDIHPFKSFINTYKSISYDKKNNQSANFIYIITK